jgi:four helix bundle protein
MGEVRSHRELLVWQKSMDLAVQVYRLTGTFPPPEQYRLVAQATRSAASVPASIAEGNARGTRREYAHFLSVAKGSLMETETHLILSTRLGYLSEAQAQPTLDLIVEISKMLTALRQKLLTEGEK